MKLSIIIAILLTGITAEATELQHFNVNVFGNSIEKPVKFLNAKKKNDIEPLTVLVDVKDGIYYAATIMYPKKLTFEEARASLNKLYKKHEKASFADSPVLGLWRNEKDKFSIQLSQEEEHFNVIYIGFKYFDQEFFEQTLEEALIKHCGKQTDEERCKK